MDLTTLRLDVADGVAHLRLARPDAANGIDLAMAKELLDVSLALAGRDDVRAVLLSGEGRMFCGGGDVRGFAASDDVTGLIRSITTYLHAAITKLVRLDAPVVCAVQGSAAGAGMGLVASSDLVVAARSAKFVMAYTGIGLTPDGSTTWFLPRLVGSRRALELSLLNRALTADEALDWGIVTKVVDDDALLDEARALAARLADGPTRAHGAVKRLIRSAWDQPLEAQLELETAEMVAATRTADAREGVTAFVQKRRPEFRGE